MGTEQPMMADDTPAIQPMAQPEPTMQQSISPMEQQPETSETMKYITGRSLEEHNQALQAARAAGDKNAIKEIQDDYKREYDYQKDTGAFTKDDTNTKALEAKQDIYKNAKYMLSVIDQIEKGELEGDAADTALNFAASRYAASQGFEEGGKALTAPELTVLGGSIPIIKSRGQSWLDKMTGNIPSQTGKVDEDIDSIKAKMLLSMNYLDGKDVTDLQGKLGAEEKGMGEKVVDFAKSTFIDPITHYAQDAGAGLALNNEDGQNMQASQQSTIENSQRLMAKADQIQATDPQQAQRLRKVAQDALAQVGADAGATSGEFSEDINTPYALRALETGATIAGGAEMIANPMMVANIAKAPFQIARHPIKTADAVANVVRHPIQAGKEFIKADIAASGYKGTGLPGGGASAGMSIDDAVGTGTPIDGQIVANAGKPIDLANDAAGRLATKVASPDMGSVVKSEKLMKTALQTTDSITRRGMARELETNIGKIGNTVDDYVRDLDTVIGDMPKDDIISSVDQILSERIPASYRPEIDQVLRNVGNDLSNGNYVGEGINEATTLVKINEVRKKLNNEIPSSWFQNGMPTNSRADVMYAIKWDVSNQLKAMLGDADLQGFINKSLGIQHASYQTYPVLSKEALTENERLGNGVFGAVRSAWDKVTTAPTIIAARNAQGQADDLTRQILRGERPKVSGGSAQLQNTDMLVENADTSIPAAKPDPGVSSTTVGQQPIQGRQYTNIRETREVTDAKGKVSLEMKDKAGKWVPYKASPTNFRKVDSASQKSVNGGMSVDDATLKIAPEGGEPRASNPRFEKDGRSLLDYNNDELTVDELQNKLVLANEGNEGRTAVKEIEDAIDSRMGTTTKTNMLPAEGANIKQVTPEEAGDVVYLTKKAFEEGRYQDAREYWEALPDGNEYKEGMRSLMEKSLRPSTISKKKINNSNLPRSKSGIQKVSIEQLEHNDPDGYKMAMDDIEEGRPSITKGSPDVVQTGDGYLILDGNHRVVEAGLRGEKDINVNVLSREEALKKYGEEFPALEGVLEASPIKAKPGLSIDDAVEKPTIPQVDESRLAFFDKEADKWTRASDYEGKQNAYDYATRDFPELGDYLRMEAFGKTSGEVELYRVGNPDGISSFFTKRSQAEAYAERMGVDSVSAWKVDIADTVPTNAGSGEVWADAGYISLVDD